MKIASTNIRVGEIGQSSLLFLAITMIPVFVIPFMDGVDNFLVETTFCLLAIQSALLMVFIKGVFGKIYYLFSYFFFSITPWIHFKNSIIFWGFSLPSNDIYCEVNFILIILNFIYLISYSIGLRIKIFSAVASNDLLITSSQYKCLLLITYVSSYIIFYLANFNIENLLYRFGNADRIEVDQTMGLLLVPVYFLPFVCVAFYLISQKKSTLKILALMIPMLLALFPTGLPRNFTALIYLTLLLIIIPGLKIGNRLVFLIFASLILAFPFLENFRSYNPSGHELMPSYDFFLASHFDSYQSFAIAYSNEIITFGHQLLGVLLFFIPRLYWEGKPIGSGHFVANMFDLPFTNISSNIYAEAYINFGIIGCIAFSIVLGFFGGKFSIKLASEQESTPKKIVLYGAVAYFVYFLRGDLLSPVAYFSAFTFCIFGVWLCLKLTKFSKMI